MIKQEFIYSDPRNNMKTKRIDDDIIVIEVNLLSDNDLRVLFVYMNDKSLELVNSESKETISTYTFKRKK